MYLEISGPAICIENENNAKVTINGEITQEIDIEMPNANLDYYLVYDEWMVDHCGVTINGRRWEMELSEAEVVLELTVDELRKSAQIRADEDCTTEIDVLESWRPGGEKRRGLEPVFSEAFHEILTGEPSPSRV